MKILSFVTLILVSFTSEIFAQEIKAPHVEIFLGTVTNDGIPDTAVDTFYLTAYRGRWAEKKFPPVK